MLEMCIEGIPVISAHLQNYFRITWHCLMVKLTYDARVLTYYARVEDTEHGHVRNKFQLAQQLFLFLITVVLIFTNIVVANRRYPVIPFQSDLILIYYSLPLCTP